MCFTKGEGAGALMHAAGGIFLTNQIVARGQQREWSPFDGNSWKFNTKYMGIH